MTVNVFRRTVTVIQHYTWDCLGKKQRVITVNTDFVEYRILITVYCMLETEKIKFCSFWSHFICIFIYIKECFSHRFGGIAGLITSFKLLNLNLFWQENTVKGFYMVFQQKDRPRTPNGSRFVCFLSDNMHWWKLKRSFVWVSVEASMLAWNFMHLIKILDLLLM